MKKKITTRKILIAIFIIGFILRLTGLYNITLDGDFKYHWSVARQIVVEGNTPLLGPVASVNEALHLGPFYYYLLAIPYALGNGNFHAAIIFFSLINSLSIFVLFKALIHWFPKSISLKIVALYAFSAYMVVIQSFPWNPFILPALISLALYCIAKIQRKESAYFPALAITLGLSIQAHATAIFLLPAVALLLPLKKVPLRIITLGLISFFITMMPWIYVDITSNFAQTKEAFAVFQPAYNTTCSITDYLKHHGNGERCFSQIRNSLYVVKMFTMSLFNSQNLLNVVLFALVSAIFILKENFKLKKVLLLWIGVPWLLYFFYSSNVYLHYFLIFFPMPFILCVLLLEKVASLHTRAKLISNVVFYLILLLNLFAIFTQLGIRRG